MGMGASAIGVLWNKESALVDANIVVPTVEDLSNCETSDEVEALEIPSEDGIVGFAGSGIIIPAPCIRDAIINAATSKPSELIPIIMATARFFDEEHIDDEEYTQLALRNADDVAAWLWSVSTGRIAETRYSVQPDDNEVNTFVHARNASCITNAPAAAAAVGANAQGGIEMGVFQQLAASIAIQNEEQTIANQMRREEFE